MLFGLKCKNCKYVAVPERFVSLLSVTRGITRGAELGPGEMNQPLASSASQEALMRHEMGRRTSQNRAELGAACWGWERGPWGRSCLIRPPSLPLAAPLQMPTLEGFRVELSGGDGDGCAGPGAEQLGREHHVSGHPMGFFPQLWATSSIIFASVKVSWLSISRQCRGTEKPTHPTLQ